MNREARVHFENAKYNAYHRRRDADMGAVQMVIAQIAAGLRAMASSESARNHLYNAMYNGQVTRNYSLEGTLVLLQQLAAGMSEEVS